MQKRYQYYTLTLETLGPVHIGNGSSLTKLDYIYSSESKTVYILESMKLFRGLQQYGLLQIFEKGLSRNMSMTDFVTKNSVPEKAYSKWAASSYSVKGIDLKRGQWEIQSFMKDAYGMPYIPGSSLKGALRTAIETAIILQKQKEMSGITEKVSAEINQAHQDFKDRKRVNMKRLLNRENQTITTNVFHTLSRKEKKPDDMLNDRMAGLMFSDSRPIALDQLTLCQKLDVFLQDERTLPILRESLKPGTKLTFDVTIDSNLFGFSIRDILDAGADAFRLYDERFRQAFIDALPAEINPEQEMYLYLGGGTGFWHKTVLNALYEKMDDGAIQTAKLLDMQFPKAKHVSFAEREQISPKTIKAAEYQGSLYEMGLCVLRFEERKL